MSIKVDREERPDVDRVYMSFVQATTGSGGWPMTRVPDAGAEAVLRRHLLSADVAVGPAGVHRSARRARARVEGRSPRVEQAAGRAARAAQDGHRHRRQVAASPTIAGADALDAAVEQFQMAFDRRRGGFGDAPKFPRPSELLFLLREHARRTAGWPRRRRRC